MIQRMTRNRRRSMWRHRDGRLKAPAYVLMVVVALGLVSGVWAVFASSAESAGPSPAYTPRGATPYSWETATPEPQVMPLPANPAVLIVGDSFTEGYGADNKKAEGYAYLLGGLIGASDVRVDGRGGTGFIDGGIGDNRPYAERLRLQGMDDAYQPNLVIIQGGLNDRRYADATPAELVDAVKVGVQTAKREFPGAQIVVLGPITYRDFSTTDNAYRAGATAAGATYISAMGSSTWLPEDASLYFEDGYHPSTAGHQAIAEGLAQTLHDRFTFG